MAIQNFSGGGFYGKLGVHVGQRLYDKFVLRTYVKTPNPKTPNQQRVRGDFSRTSKRASFSLNLNPRTPQISTQTMPAMAARNKIAIALEKNGAADLDLLPLFELEKQPNYLLNRITLVRQDNERAYFQVAGTLPLVSRTLNAVFILDEEEFEIENCKLTNGFFVLSGADYNLILEKPAVWTFDEKTRIVLISNDDAQNQNTFVWLPCSFVDLTPIPERAFDFTISSFTRNQNVFEIVFAENYITGAQNFEDFTLHCISNGSFGNFSIENPTLTNKNGKFAIQFSCTYSNEWEIWAFPNGSYFTISNLIIYGEEIVLKAQNAQITLTSSDLTRNRTISMDLSRTQVNTNENTGYIQSETFQLEKVFCDAAASWDSEFSLYTLPRNVQTNIDPSPANWLEDSESAAVKFDEIEDSIIPISAYSPSSQSSSFSVYFRIWLITSGDYIEEEFVKCVQSGKYFFEDLTVQNVNYRIKIDCPQNAHIAVGN